MKKITFLFCCLLASSFLFGQNKIKTIKTVSLELQNGKIIPFSGRTNIYLYDKVAEYRTCWEHWDTLSNKGKFDYANYDILGFEKQGSTSSTINRHYNIDFLGIKKIQGYEISTNQNNKVGYPIFGKGSSYDADNNLVYMRIDSNVYNTKNQFVSSVSYAYDLLKKSYNIRSANRYFYTPNGCEDSTYYVNFQEKDTAFWISSKIEGYLDTSCNYPSKITRKFWNAVTKRYSSYDIQEITYADNYQNIFRKYRTPISYCDHGLEDRSRSVLGNPNQFEIWFSDSSYLKKIFSDSENTLSKTYKTANNYGTQYFYFYDSHDNLILEEKYSIKNGKIDSSSLKIWEKHTYEYNTDGNLTRAKRHYYDDIYPYETIWAYNCIGNLTKMQNFSKFTIDTKTTEYYDDPCEENPLTQTDFRIFPNPVKDKIYLKKGESLIFDEIQITNQLGKVEKQMEIDKCDIQVEIDVSDLNPGYYFLSVSSKDNASKKTTKAFVKIK